MIFAGHVLKSLSKTQEFQQLLLRHAKSTSETGPSECLRLKEAVTIFLPLLEFFAGKHQEITCAMAHVSNEILAQVGGPVRPGNYTKICVSDNGPGIQLGETLQFI